MKTVRKLIVMMLAIVALLALSATVYASKDSRIESSAKNSYIFKTYLQGDDIKIKSKNGEVTLTGTVANNHHKLLAQETVVGLAGVGGVDNELEVKDKSPAENSDEWISAKVKTPLLFHRSVSAVTIVNTKDGIVTLQGEANSQAQKDLTTEYAKDVEGVKDVKNEMTLGKTSKTTRTAGQKIDDASITAQVKMTLLYHRSTSAINTSVTTKRGVVTLTGKAKTAGKKDLATKFAKDVNGVKSVKNRMSIG
jgi:hyperosmotically inducible protein